MVLFLPFQTMRTKQNVYEFVLLFYQRLLLKSPHVNNWINFICEIIQKMSSSLTKKIY